MSGTETSAGGSNGKGKSTASGKGPAKRVATRPAETNTESVARSQTKSDLVTSLKNFTRQVTSLGNIEDHPPDPNVICDEKFNKDLDTLRSLHSFLIRDATSLREAFSLEMLNNLKAGEKGRQPTDAEWQAVEQKTQQLFKNLQPDERKRFLASQMPTFLPQLAVWLVGVSIVAMIFAVVMAGMRYDSPGFSGGMMVFSFVIWLMCLGAIGSAAFIGFNAISVTSDITFDISNPQLIVQRIVLGALFALFFTLPFGFEGFMDFTKELSTPWGPGEAVQTVEMEKSATPFTQQSLILIMPFVLGYSTSLVILVLNRMISSASTLFGAQQPGSRDKDTRPTEREAAVKPQQ